MLRIDPFINGEYYHIYNRGYFAILLILVMWQLVSFIQKRNSKNLIQN